MFLGLSARSVRVGTLRLQSEFRQPEIENLCLNSIRNKNVGWLDVPMNDTFRVCGVQGIPRSISRTGPEPQGLVDVFRAFTLRRAAHISKIRKTANPKT